MIMSTTELFTRSSSATFVGSSESPWMMVKLLVMSSSGMERFLRRSRSLEGVRTTGLN
jgi:hypothetical protein